VFHYYLKAKPGKDAPVSLEIRENDGKLIRRVTTKAGPSDDKPGKGGRRAGPPAKLEPKQGMNRFTWDLRYPDAESFPGMVLWGGLQGPRARPGIYQARLVLGKESRTVRFEVSPDPRSSATTEDFDAQFRFLLAARDKLTQTHRAIRQIRDIREQTANIGKRLKSRKEAARLCEAAAALEKKLNAIEEALYQTKAQSSQDVLNFPVRLNNKLASLAGAAGMGDNRPTDQMLELGKIVTAQIDAELAKLHTALREDLPRFNEMLVEMRIPGVFAESADRKGRPEEGSDR
jgi:hypothetical protein